MLPLFVKIFDEEEYANEFLNGVLYSNRLSYFKKLEDEEGRGDKYEGGIFIPSDQAIIKLTATNLGNQTFEQITIPSEDLAAAVRIGPDWFNNVNVFCMYSCFSQDVNESSDSGRRDVKITFQMPNKALKLGDCLVVVCDVRAFLDRFRKSTEELGYDGMHGLVKYFDPEHGSLPFKSREETIFMKRKKFEDQKEYRLAFNTDTIGSDPVKLSIGSIRDIAMRANPDN